MDRPRLTTQQTADRLGVRPQTVYAYVSRGLLRSERTASGRGSTFDREEVDALLDRGRRVRPQLAGARNGALDRYARGVVGRALAEDVHGEGCELGIVVHESLRAEDAGARNARLVRP